MNSSKYAKIQKTRRGDYLVYWFNRVEGRSETIESAENIVYSLRRAHVLDSRARMKRSREISRNEKSITTPERYRKQIALQSCLHTAYNGLTIQSQRANAIDRYMVAGHIDHDRNIGRLAESQSVVLSASDLYEMAASAHHRAAVARQSGNGAAWDVALADMESALKQFDSLNIYGICKMDFADDEQRYIGAFPTAEEAARAYDDYAKSFHGRFAKLNFPMEGEQ